MDEEAWLLGDFGPAGPLGRVARILDFFGVKWRAVPPAQLLAEVVSGQSAGSKVRLFASADVLANLLAQCSGQPAVADWWRGTVHSAFVSSNSGVEGWNALLRHLSSDSIAVPFLGGKTRWNIAKDHAELTGPLAGLEVSGDRLQSPPKFAFQGGAGLVSLLSSGAASAMVRGDCLGVPVILSIAEVLDLEQKLAEHNFDLRGHLLSAAPVVMYIRWAFPQSAWHAPEINACLIIDDPLLKPQYGFVNYDELLRLMLRHDFSTNIAFIPWNWRRSSSRIAKMFRDHADRYSLSVHGCDHTAGEFGTPDIELLAWKARQAVERMSRHEQSTGISHDRVMVFPQGIFSNAAMEVLKQSGFAAAVNTEVVSTDPKPPTITIADVWNVAAMTYGDFPLFTRRYPDQGIENFAFDVLLGKPCLIVTHHDYCQDHCAGITRLVDQLNRLAPRPVWRSLGEVVRRGYRQRQEAPGSMEIEMFGAELRLENRTGSRLVYRIQKREASVTAIREIHANGLKIEWSAQDGLARFEVALEAGQSADVVIAFQKYAGKVSSSESTRSKMKTMLRRYLSEVRDNYVVKAKRTFAARGAKSVVAGGSINGVKCS